MDGAEAGQCLLQYTDAVGRRLRQAEGWLKAGNEDQSLYSLHQLTQGCNGAENVGFRIRVGVSGEEADKIRQGVGGGGGLLQL